MVLNTGMDVLKILTARSWIQTVAVGGVRALLLLGRTLHHLVSGRRPWRSTRLLPSRRESRREIGGELERIIPARVHDLLGGRAVVPPCGWSTSRGLLHAALPRPFHVVPSMLPRFIRDCDQEDEDDPGA